MSVCCWLVQICTGAVMRVCENRTGQEGSAVLWSGASCSPVAKTPSHQVGCKALVFPKQFKTQQYYNILQQICPELDKAQPGALKSQRWVYPRCTPDLPHCLLSPSAGAGISLCPLTLPQLPHPAILPTPPGSQI